MPPRVRRRGLRTRSLLAPVPPCAATSSPTYSASRAVKANRVPSGEGRAPRTCVTTRVESLIGYSNFASAPICWSTSAENGTALTRPDGTSTRQILPSKLVISAFESGVKAEAG